MTAPNDGPSGRGFRRTFRLPARRQHLDADVDAELRFHLEGRVEELMVREGLPRDVAEREARRRFGNVERYRRETRAIDHHTHTRRLGMDTFGDVRRETRTALRTLGRAPTFSLIALVTLALGIGAATAIFTLLDRVVLRPLPYANADRLVRVATSWPVGPMAGRTFGISRYMYHRFGADARTLENLAVYSGDGYLLPAEHGRDAERVLGVDASASLFDVLGFRPALGRLFTADEQRQRESRVVVLTHALWQRRFGGDAAIVGRSIEVGGGARREVIGVLSPGAELPDRKAEFYEPLYLDPAAAPQNHHVFTAIGLVRPGVTTQGAYAELDALTRRITDEYPNVYGTKFLERTGFALTLRTLRDDVVGPKAVRVLWTLFASVGLVLLIAAANVANLFLVRTEARRRDVAVRTALGAGRAQLATHFLSESLLLAAGAALGAAALGWTLLRVVLHYAPATLPRLDEVAFDLRSALFCAAVSLAAGLTFGLMPLPYARLDVPTLRDGGRGLTASRGRRAARRTLVVAQVALAVVLLAAAGLMLKSFGRLRAVRPGFDASDVTTMRLLLLGDRYRTDAQLVAFWHDVTRRVESLPGVTSVGATAMIPLSGDGGCTGVHTDRPGPDGSPRAACVPTLSVTPGYFRTLGIPVRGRATTWADDEAGSGAMVVSRSLAERLWPGENAVGKTLVYSMRRPLRFTVVGIAADVRANGLQQPPIDAAYLPLAPPAAAGPPKGGGADMGAASLSLVVRSSAASARTDGQLVAAIRRTLREIDPQVPLMDVEPLEAIAARSIAQTSFTMLLLALSAAIALVLSAVGIYGVISYLVAQRRNEIGVRVALGAPSGRVGRMVVMQSMGMAVAGALIGVVVAAAGGRLLGALLFEVSPTDPVVLTVVPIVLVAIAAVASLAPAWRATHVDPVAALRMD